MNLESDQLGCWKCGGRADSYNVLWGRCGLCRRETPPTEELKRLNDKIDPTGYGAALRRLRRR